jgi:hypothetical protein
MIETLSENELWKLQQDTFNYFVRYQNQANGLIADSTKKDSACSIAAVGLALSAYVVAAERGWVTRQEACSYIHKTLDFFWNAEQSEKKNATGYQGFFYHFLDMQSGERAIKSEISTIDSSYIYAGALTAASYFDRDNDTEQKIRNLAEKIYSRANWQWAQNKGEAVSHGWRPEQGMIRYRWEGYTEALILYVLALASPTYALPASSYLSSCLPYQWKKIYGIEFLFAAPMFIHQLSHIWIDFRGIQDDYMRSKSIDYFENSRRATYVQQQYAIRNPKRFRGYGEFCWGISASDGPGPATFTVDGIRRRFYDYKARGVPWGPDDGTLAPWAVVASIPFAPEIVLPTLRQLNTRFPEMSSQYGYKCSFNPTFIDQENDKKGWLSVGHYGLDQGPVILAIENYRSGLIWRLTRNSTYFVNGLRKAGFRGSWLDSK